MTTNTPLSNVTIPLALTLTTSACQQSAAPIPALISYTEKLSGKPIIEAVLLGKTDIYPILSSSQLEAISARITAHLSRKNTLSAIGLGHMAGDGDSRANWLADIERSTGHTPIIDAGGHLVLEPIGHHSPAGTWQRHALEVSRSIR